MYVSEVFVGLASIRILEPSVKNTELKTNSYYSLFICIFAV